MWCQWEKRIEVILKSTQCYHLFGICGYYNMRHFHVFRNVLNMWFVKAAGNAISVNPHLINLNVLNYLISQTTFILQNVSLFRLFFNLKILKNFLEHKQSSILDHCLRIYSLEVKVFIGEPSFPPKSLNQFSFPTQF